MEEQTADSSVQVKLREKMKPLLLVGGILLIIISLSGTALVIAETYHKDRIFKGVFLGPLDLGGLTRDEAANVLETWHDQWWKDQMIYEAFDERGNLLTEVSFYPIIVSEEAGQSYQYIWYDTEAMLEKAYNHGRSASIFRRIGNQLNLLIEPVVLTAEVQIDKEQLMQVLKLKLHGYETEAVNATIEIKNNQPSLIAEQAGNTFDYPAAITRTAELLTVMKKEPVALQREQRIPQIKTEDVQQALQHYQKLTEAFPLNLTYLDPRIGFHRDWQLFWNTAASSVEVVDAEDMYLFALDPQKLDAFWKQIESVVNAESKDAKFSLGEDNKVELFQPSENGYELDREKTASAINTYLQKKQLDSAEEAEPIKLFVNIVEPNIGTADVNDLGISEVLGVGYSNFSGSPANRIHNIGVGADKLNGMLIAPGEEFSLLSALRPFTYAGGYLPELVIKGDKIEPEIGGGLCQIGSTTFRAAMKSGLDITQRRNHSLVVSYYNDPRNGNPGTDATIYDPAPDFRFLNDTGNYILIKTDMNAYNGDLYFTFWGTSDGRKADYTEPVVERWIPTGPTQYIETADLEPGQEKCQGRHPGAVASFTYSIERPDGSLEEEVFTSSYRPLPTICLVGIDPEAEESESLEEQASTNEQEVPQEG